MSRNLNRRRNTRLKRMTDLRDVNPQAFAKKLRQLLWQWAQEVRHRAGRFTYEDGQPVPAVWDLYRRKLIEATALGIHEELAEICRQAIAKYIGTGTTRLGTSMLGPGVRLVTVRA